MFNMLDGEAQQFCDTAEGAAAAAGSMHGADLQVVSERHVGSAPADGIPSSVDHGILDSSGSHGPTERKAAASCPLSVPLTSAGTATAKPANLPAHSTSQAQPADTPRSLPGSAEGRALQQALNVSPDPAALSGVVHAAVKMLGSASSADPCLPEVCLQCSQGHLDLCDAQGVCS